jgi:hypothetical protein
MRQAGIIPNDAVVGQTTAASSGGQFPGRIVKVSPDGRHVISV